jgi:predicted PurR-regulated permease PerM
VPVIAPTAPLQSPAAWRATLRTVLIVVAVVVTIYLLYLLRKPLTWLFIAGFIAIALAGPVTFLQRWLPRGLAIAAVYVGLIVSPLLIMAILVPPIVTQANNLITNLPQYATDVSNFVSGNPTLHRLQQDYDVIGKLQAEAAKLPGRIGDAAGLLSNIGLGVVNSVFTTVTIIILSIFLMGAGPRWLEMWASRHEPERGEWWRRLFRRIGNAVGNYVAGALLQATVAGVSSYVVLLILGVPFALPLAVIIFLLDLVPLVGATLGAVLVGIVTVFSGFPVDTIVWTIWAIIYHPGARRAAGAADRAGQRAVRLDAVRRPRRAAGDPGRGRDPDHDPRVQHAAQPLGAGRGRVPARATAPAAGRRVAARRGAAAPNVNCGWGGMQARPARRLPRAARRLPRGARRRRPVSSSSASGR